MNNATEWRLALAKRIADVFDLVERHAPDFDSALYRAVLTNRRAVWDDPPPE